MANIAEPITTIKIGKINKTDFVSIIAFNTIVKLTSVNNTFDTYTANINHQRYLCRFHKAITPAKYARIYIIPVYLKLFKILSTALLDAFDVLVLTVF